MKKHVDWFEEQLAQLENDERKEDKSMRRFAAALFIILTLALGALVQVYRSASGLDPLALPTTISRARL
jgi:hypothetical protein